MADDFIDCTSEEKENKRQIQLAKRREAYARKRKLLNDEKKEYLLEKRRATYAEQKKKKEDPININRRNSKLQKQKESYVRNKKLTNKQKMELSCNHNKVGSLRPINKKTRIPSMNNAIQGKFLLAFLTDNTLSCCNNS
jgi:hypothetical protein